MRKTGTEFYQPCAEMACRKIDLSSILGPMRTLLHTEFLALLKRATLSQVAFAQVTGVSTRQVNKWATGAAVVPLWAGVLAAAMLVITDEVSVGRMKPDEVTRHMRESAFGWYDILGIDPSKATRADAQKAYKKLALRYHPDQGGSNEAMRRVTAAWEAAKRELR